MEPRDSVAASFPFAPLVVRAVAGDPVLLSGWLAEDPAEALAIIGAVSVEVHEIEGGAELVVRTDLHDDDLARARFVAVWRRRFADLAELLRGRPVDWSARSTASR